MEFRANATDTSIHRCLAIAWVRGNYDRIQTQTNFFSPRTLRNAALPA